MQDLATCVFKKVKCQKLHPHLESDLPTERQPSEVFWPSIANGANKQIKPRQTNKRAC